MKTETIQAQIESSVEKEQGWKPGEFEVRPSAVIQLPPCAFFTATHKSLPMAFPANYAVLADGQVLGDADPEAADKILGACASQQPASAGSWAEVLARFHPEAGPGTVLYEKDKAPTAVGKLEAAGKSFAPPSLTSGQDGTRVQFYLMNYETGVLYSVTATRRADGTLEVSRTPAP